MKKLFILLALIGIIPGFVFAATAPTNFTMSAPTSIYSPISTIKCTFTMQVATAGLGTILHILTN